MNYLTLFISLRCTQTCAHCLYGCSPEIGEHMSWDVFARSVSIAKESRISTLNFFGGEPLLNPQFFPMLQMALGYGFSVMLATNCRPLSNKELYARFVSITNIHKDNVHIFTARDRFHLRHFDPVDVIDKLRMGNYEVSVSDYSDKTVLLSEYNVHNQELRNLDNHYSCCGGRWTDYLGVLPNGGWTICPPSLEAFGNIFANSLEEIVEFKRGLPLRYGEDCTECLKDFKDFRKAFDRNNADEKSNII